ncbi:MAG: hypothetical protein KGD66_02870 [Candidatus Lokiarchaeota archaeon]|nr:hypothetical protein [Candidatus Lokiarchaeota archaeon]
MNIKNWKNKTVIGMILGQVLFLILVFLAMIFYAGGTRDNPALIGYSFWGNTLSDSGRIIAWSGLLNITSMVFLSTALIVYAVFFIPFYLILSKLFSGGKIEKYASKIGFILGVIFSLSYIGIASTPADVLYTPHMIFVLIGYICAFVMSVCFTIAFFKNKEFSNIYATIFALFTIFYFVTQIIALVNLSSDRNLMVLMQKLGTFVSIGVFFILGYGIWKYEE